MMDETLNDVCVNTRSVGNHMFIHLVDICVSGEKQEL